MNWIQAYSPGLRHERIPTYGITDITLMATALFITQWLFYLTTLQVNLRKCM